MKTILVLGAGRSSASLIRYLLTTTPNLCNVIVGDISISTAQQRVYGFSKGSAIFFSIEDEIKSRETIANADVVISLLPAQLHPSVARLCLLEKKHLLTASYVSDEMNLLDREAKKNNLLFLNECGLDPGIDHMTAMQLIDRIHLMGGEVLSFESFTGGLIAPETDIHNPWRYKFTWNPRNVVMAGAGTAKYIEEGHYKYIPHHQLFKRTTPVSVHGYGLYEGYANRDSLKYKNVYGLKNVQTMIRGTLRNKGYCAAWNVLVQLGCCDESYEIEDLQNMTHREFINSFLSADNTKQTEEKLCVQLGIDIKGEEMKRLIWSGFFSDEKIELPRATPAQITEYILNKKWRLQPHDKDMIVMWHRLRYVHNGQKKEMQASLVCEGEDAIQTAMAKTVGLPLGIASSLLIQGKIKERGVVIPIGQSIYEPILKELSVLGITMNELEQ